MATDTLFPFYDILVESIFGGVGIAIMGVAVILILILLISRSTILFISYWMFFYFMVMGTLYLGGIVLVFSFIFAFGFLIYSLIKQFSGEG